MYRIFAFLFLLVIGSFKAQYLKLSIKDTVFNYSVKDEFNPLKIVIGITNVTNTDVGFVLDTNSLGVYEQFDKYIIEENTPEESGLYENIFSPRIILFSHNTTDSLKLDFYLNDIDLTEKALLQEYNRQKKISEDEVLNLKKYSKTYFPKKSLQFAEKAKYINDNFVILKANETKTITLNFDPKIYKNDGNFKGIGFPVKKGNLYDFIIKIHTDAAKTSMYLDNTNKRVVKDKIKLISEDIYLKGLLLNVN